MCHPRAIAATLLCIFVATSAGAAECDCSKLPEMQAELRNALKLQAAFRNEISTLRGAGTNTSRLQEKQFAEGAARRGLEPVDGGADGTGAYDYVPYGEGVSDDYFETPSYPGQTAQERQNQLCAARPSSAALLEATVKATACNGIGRALRVHEARHVSFCRSLGYRAYLSMHGADRAAEEVEAYGEQIAALRREIALVIERLNPRIVVTTKSRMAAPAAISQILYSAIDSEMQVDVTVGHAQIAETPAALLRVLTARDARR